MIRVIINGASGAMGQKLSQAIDMTDGMETVAGAALNGEGGFYSRLEEYQGPADIVIDFSHHSDTVPLMDYCVSRGLPAVVCTTGQTEAEMEYIAKAAESIPVFKSANMSVGVALTAKIVREVAAKFGACDIEILEIHHNRKVDAPSGTALMIADGISETLEQEPMYVYDRHSYRKKRAKNEIGIHSVRGGTIVGEHEVIFAGHDEVVTVSHQAQSKEVFAAGAVNAAVFLAGQQPGMYDMGKMLASKFE